MRETRSLPTPDWRRAHGTASPRRTLSGNAAPAGGPSSRQLLRAGTLLGALPPDEGAVALTDASRVIVAAGPCEVVSVRGTETFELLDTLATGWWAGLATYDLGRAVEHVDPRSRDDLAIPDLLLGRFAARAIIEPGREVRIEGHGRGQALLASALDRTDGGCRNRVHEVMGGGHRARSGGDGPALGVGSSSLEGDAWEAAVRAILARIAAGECYQVNLTRRISWGQAADPVALYGALARRSPAPHAAFVRLGDLAAVSASPERFLRRDGAAVETRPIKGTGSAPGPLAASAKDRAENVMIVDLARNDLGRVCLPGSVRVPSLCAVEQHPGLVHLVSTVRGQLEPGRGMGVLLRATFPPASVTGAPKPRVMQIIEDLEPVRRGVYCGAVGWIDADRSRADLSVAIRTFTITAAGTTLGVGGGIVADSDPAAEWQETELKAARLLEAAGATEAATTEVATTEVATTPSLGGRR